MAFKTLVKSENQNWTDYTRTVIAFGLGVALIIFAIVQKGLNLPILIVGLLLMGIVPVDALLARLGLGKNGKTNGQPPNGGP